MLSRSVTLIPSFTIRYHLLLSCTNAVHPLYRLSIAKTSTILITLAPLCNSSISCRVIPISLCALTDPAILQTQRQDLHSALWSYDRRPVCGLYQSLRLASTFFCGCLRLATSYSCCQRRFNFNKALMTFYFAECCRGRRFAGRRRDTEAFGMQEFQDDVMQPLYRIE